MFLCLQILHPSNTLVKIICAEMEAPAAHLGLLSGTQGNSCRPSRKLAPVRSARPNSREYCRSLRSDRTTRGAHDQL